MTSMCERARRLALSLGLLTALTASMAMPVAAQDADGIMVPTELGGVPAEVAIQTGTEVLAGLDPADPDDAEQVRDIELLLEATGGTPEQLTLVSVFPSDNTVGAFIVAIRVEGADRAFLTSAFVSSLWPDLDQPRLVASDIGGKPVLLVFDDSFEADPFVFYGSGDTAWLMAGPEDVTAAALAELP